MDIFLEYVLNRLKQERLKHEIHEFPSGAVMVDIWKEDKFYVIQIMDKKIGLGLITSDTGLDAIPDKSYDNFEEFNIDFKKIFE